MFMKKPTKANAIKNFDPVAFAQKATTTDAAVPNNGPASPERASWKALRGLPFIPTKAPRNGIKSGAVAGTPCRRSSTTWPISCTKIKSTKHAAKVQPKNSEYAAMETSMDSTRPMYLSLISSAPNFARKAPIAARAPTTRSHTRLSVLFGLPVPAGIGVPRPAGRSTPSLPVGCAGTGVRSVAHGGVPWPFTGSGHQSPWGGPCGPPGGASWDGAAADGQPGWSPSGDVPQIGPLSSNVHRFGQPFVSLLQDTDRRPRGVLRRVARPGSCC